MRRYRRSCSEVPRWDRRTNLSPTDGRASIASILNWKHHITCEHILYDIPVSPPADSPWATVGSRRRRDVEKLSQRAHHRGTERRAADRTDMTSCRNSSAGLIAMNENRERWGKAAQVWSAELTTWARGTQTGGARVRLWDYRNAMLR